jgi:hypothetical protein
MKQNTCEESSPMEELQENNRHEISIIPIQFRNIFTA